MKKSTVILILSLLALLGGCAKEALKTTYDKQAGFIEGFISTQMKTDTNATYVRRGGAYRLTLHDTLDRVLPGRDTLREGGKVVLQYVCYTLTGSSIGINNLVATNVLSVAQHAGWNLSDTTRFKSDTLVLDASLVQGLRDGLVGVKPYDEYFILFTGEFGFGNMSRGTIPARSALAYQVLIEQIDNE